MSTPFWLLLSVLLVQMLGFHQADRFYSL
ncbi:MAG: hypothetical protein ACLS5G_04040 [Streptococcus sp.]